MADDDLLDDLAQEMGNDFGFGYDEDLGDPNVKPKPPPAPTEVADRRTHDTLVLQFPKQQQFLTKLVLQATPAPPPDAKAGESPFAGFSSQAADNRVVEAPGDAKTANQIVLTALKPGQRYVVRLVATNPSGTVAGRVSDAFMTTPNKPDPPTLQVAEANSAIIQFPAQHQSLEALQVEVVRGDGDMAGEKAFENGTLFIGKVGKPQTTEKASIVGLVRGQRYFARLRISNMAGEAVSEPSEPFITLPIVPVVDEDHSKRTDTQVALRFEACGDYTTKLEVEVCQGSKPSFDKATSYEVPEAKTATSYIVTKLEPGKKHFFRLKVSNISGLAYSDPLAVETVEFAPDMLDKSGWLLEMPQFEGKKTLGRRLSMRKTKPKKFWYVLDGKLLTWYTDVGGEEVGFMHLGKITEIGGDEYSAETVSFSLKDRTEKVINIMCESTDPNVTANELCIGWIKSLKAAWRPSARPMSPEKETSRPSTAPKKAEPVVEVPQPVAEVPEAEPEANGADGEEEEFGF